jgi:2-polyprenyl-6-methoxyphenol hydroxylase-like FAD-dependent oxidoreductase
MTERANVLTRPRPARARARHRSDTVVIAGGGIGGLAAAIALLRAGVRVRVLERVAELGEVGAGVGLWTNAIRALDHLGIGEEVRGFGAPLTIAEVRSARGAMLSRLDLHSVLGEAAAANHIVHRATLHAALAAKLPKEHVTTGAEVVGFRERGNGVEAVLADGEVVHGALLIGADGIRSAVRRALWGDEPLRYSGQTCFRGIARFEVADARVLREVQGAGLRAAVCPLADGRVYWWAAINAPCDEPDEPPLRKAALLQRFHGWPFGVPEAIAATEGAILRNDLVDRPPRQPWGRARVTLLGDAAHPMLPNLGQGACTALEDAVVLARCVESYGPTARALQAYERTRYARTARIVRESWSFGVPARWSHPFAVGARETIVRALPTSILARSIRAHIDFDAATVPIPRI